MAEPRAFTSQDIDDEDFWDLLIDKVESGRVLPIVGWNVTTLADGNELAEKQFASFLAEKLRVDRSRLPESFGLNDVITLHLMSGNFREYIYSGLHKILRDNDFRPGETLRQLAEITGFKCFLTTTFAPLLALAIDQVRHAGESKTIQCGYSPVAQNKDLPSRMAATVAPTVYHLLGRASAVGDFVACEDDVLEFILKLNEHMPVLKNLSSDLSDNGVHVLMLGLNFNDWVTRFFMRTARQNRLDGFSRLDCIADHEPEPGCLDELVMFFGSVDRRIRVLPCDPRDFVSQLSERWRDRNPTQNASPLMSASLTGINLDRPAFISYAREDEKAATNLVRGLRAAGIEVWLDTECIKGGDNWESTCEQGVKQCGVFISLISESTELEEGNWNTERHWAETRFKKLPAHKQDGFYQGVIIDGRSALSVQNCSKLFGKSQMTKLANGIINDEFVETLKKYLT